MYERVSDRIVISCANTTKSIDDDLKLIKKCFLIEKTRPRGLAGDDAYIYICNDNIY